MISFGAGQENYPSFYMTPYLSKPKRIPGIHLSKISRKVIEDYQPFLQHEIHYFRLTPEQLTYSSEKQPSKLKNSVIKA